MWNRAADWPRSQVALQRDRQHARNDFGRHRYGRRPGHSLFDVWGIPDPESYFGDRQRERGLPDRFSLRQEKNGRAPSLSLFRYGVLILRQVFHQEIGDAQRDQHEAANTGGDADSNDAADADDETEESKGEMEIILWTARR